MIYIASPYTDPDSAIREQRARAAAAYTAGLAKKNELCFCPICHSHVLPAFDVPQDWYFWERFDKPFLNLCEELHVLMLDGWDRSRGVANEIRFFVEAAKPIKYVYQ